MADDLADQWAELDNEEVDVAGLGEHDDLVDYHANEVEERGVKRKEVPDDAANPAVAKKKQHKKKKTITKRLQEEPDQPLEPDTLRQCMRAHLSLTAVEIEDNQLVDEHFAACNDLTHTSNSFFDLLLPKWKKLVSAERPAGQPLVLVICPAALRAAELNRNLTEFKRGCKVAKLFAKHMKQAEQEKFLSKHAVHLAVGTPARLQALLDVGALSLAATSHVVLDWSWRDSKQRRLQDVPEVHTDLLRLLCAHVIPRVRSGQAKLALL